ncbi:MAG: hypothetical protein ACLGHY_13555, partial [Gammaproteobacteria bacterium]
MCTVIAGKAQRPPGLYPGPVRRTGVSGRIAICEIGNDNSTNNQCDCRSDNLQWVLQPQCAS